jgi:hypothetical protein
MGDSLVMVDLSEDSAVRQRWKPMASCTGYETKISSGQTTEQDSRRIVGVGLAYLAQQLGFYSVEITNLANESPDRLIT